MANILDGLRTQYWFWFLRDKLIEIKINERLTSKERAKLEEVRDKPLLLRRYSDANVGKDLDRIGEVTNGSFFHEFSINGNGDKYRSGTRIISKNWIISADAIIPGSVLAYQEGPQKLFSILEANDLAEATIMLAKELRHIIANNVENLHQQPELYPLFDRLTLSLFGTVYSSYNALTTVNDLIDYLFPQNDWCKPEVYIETVKSKTEDLNLNQLRQPRYLNLEILVPVVIAYAFIRSRFFLESHYLAKVCYEDGFLKVLEARYLMKESRWSFSKKKVPGEKNELNLNYVIKDRFNKAFRHSKMIDEKADFQTRVRRKLEQLKSED